MYVILDLYSRYVTGWMVARRESGTLAKRLISEAMAKQGIAHGSLTVQADRGPSMTSKTLALLLAELEPRTEEPRTEVRAEEARLAAEEAGTSYGTEPRTELKNLVRKPLRDGRPLISGLVSRDLGRGVPILTDCARL